MTLSTFANNFACSAAPGQSHSNAPYYTDQSTSNTPCYTGQSSSNAPYYTGLLNDPYTHYHAGSLHNSNITGYLNTVNNAGSSNNQAIPNSGGPMPK
jgi:hypothetical protein